MGLIYLDACLVIYEVELHPQFSAPLRRAMAVAGEARFAISPLVKCECLVAPHKRSDPSLLQRFESFFAQLVQLPIIEEDFLQAAQLRARFGLRTPDALHLACAQRHQCESLWTNDARLQAASFGLARDILA